MTELVDLLIADDRWSSAGIAVLAERAARLALAGAACAAEGREIGLLACDDARIRQLNLDFRGKDVPTNVLSWPGDDLAAAGDGDQPLPPPSPDGLWKHSLGDLAIAYETCAREASAADIPFADHVTHLVLHGCLHLLGYDHQRDGDAALMEALETRVLASAGIADPYAVRNPVGAER